MFLPGANDLLLVCFICAPKFRRNQFLISNYTTWICLFREQNQWPGQKYGKAVGRKSRKKTSRGSQHLSGEDGRGWGTHGETHWVLGPQCIALVHSKTYLYIFFLCGDSSLIWRGAVTGWSPLWKTNRKCLNQPGRALIYPPPAFGEPLQEKVPNQVCYSLYVEV